MTVTMEQLMGGRRWSALLLAGWFGFGGMAGWTATLPETRPERQGVSSERLERVHDVVRSYVDEGKHAGVVWLLARHGRIVDWGAYGERESGKPMERDTICRVYSMSKIITSTAVLMLLEEGRLGLEDPVESYLPELADRKVWEGGTASDPRLVSAREPITILHLLTHTSGLTYGFLEQGELGKVYRESGMWGCVSLKEFVRKVSRLPLKHHPGEAFTYGISSDVLGRLVEVVSGMPFEAYLRERIFLPLEMEDTGFSVPAEKRDRLARIYQPGPQGTLVVAESMLGVMEEPGLGFPSGGAGLFSTVSDYARFAQMLLNGGYLGKVRLLSPKTVQLMRQNFLEDLEGGGTHQFSDAHGFGLGVEVRLKLTKGGGPGSLGQFGWYGAATTYCNIDPEEQTLALVFVQHFPFNQHGLFSRFSTAWYQSLVE